MKLDKDFKEFIELLNEQTVEYLIIGGYAVNLHGYPRYTKDIDIWIHSSSNNIKKLISAIASFGFASLDLKEEDFQNPKNIIQLGRAPYRIDLLSDVDGITFADCYQRKEKILLEGTNINFLSIQDLIKAKKTSGRAQDLADAEQLEKIKQESN